MSGNLVAELRSGRDGPASAWKVFLPEDTKALEGFREPISIVLTGAVATPGQAPESPDHPMKVYAGESERWLDTSALVEAFTQLWLDALQSIAELRAGTVNLVYLAAQATQEDLYSLWPYMPFGPKDERRFFVSEVRKSSRTRIPACGWVCVEYAYEDFRRMVGPDGFWFRYGTTIMGTCVSEGKAAEYLSLRFLDKTALERALTDDELLCWWFCDTDFEGMTIWHKDLPGPDLAKRLQRITENRAH